jgi:hypothetical protein
MRLLQIRAENSNGTVSGGRHLAVRRRRCLFRRVAHRQVLYGSIKSTKEARLFEMVRNSTQSMNVR